METLGKLWRALGESGDRRTSIVITTITVANIILSLGKIGRSYYDSSLSIFTSGLESFGDVFACFIIAYNRYLEQNSNPVEFPRGRETKALGYASRKVLIIRAEFQVTCAWVMIVLAMGSFIYDFESVFVKKVAPQLTLVDISVMGGNIVLKLFLWLICFGSKSTELKVLQMDQLNDILNNLITIVSVAATMYFYYLFDLAGAVIICCIIIRNWAKVMSKYSKRVHGRSVSPELLSEIIEHAAAHSHGKKIKETVAYYKGQSIVLEVSVFCKLTNYHEIAEEVREHMLKFDDIHQVHVFPFDTRKISMEIVEEGIFQLQGIKSYSTDNISYVTADGESEPIQSDGEHNAMIEPVDVNEQSPLNPEI